MGSERMKLLVPLFHGYVERYYVFELFCQEIREGDARGGAWSEVIKLKKEIRSS